MSYQIVIQKRIDIYDITIQDAVYLFTRYLIQVGFGKNLTRVEFSWNSPDIFTMSNGFVQKHLHLENSKTFGTIPSAKGN